jgi:hypothetical protein
VRLKTFFFLHSSFARCANEGRYWWLVPCTQKSISS